MACWRVAIVTVGLLLLAVAAQAQYQPPSDYLLMVADQACTWTEGPTNVVQLSGRVTIRTDRALLSADQAVVWLTPLPETVLNQQQAEIALIGQAKLQQAGIERGGDSLYVTTQVRGTVRITAEQRIARDLSESELYRQASTLRSLTNIPPGAETPPAEWIVQRPWMIPPPSTAPVTQPALPRPAHRVSFRAGVVETIITPESKLAAVLSAGVTVVQVRPDGQIVQLQADRAVLFTPIASLRELGASEKLRKIEEAADAVYLEGDVRVILTPSGSQRGEQYLRASRVYYDLTTDRAVLTDAVVHTIEPELQLPLIIRARLVRQLSIGEYRAEKVELSTSSFAVPSYSIRSDRAYVRQYDTADPRLGQRTVFSAWHNTFNAFGLPLFYWPWAAGSVTDRGFPLREVQLGSSRGFGSGIRTRWGFFESIGQAPPEDLDISYRLDYFDTRGPAWGVNTEYGGGFVTETTKQPWNFKGKFTSYFVQDHGEDRFGSGRRLVTPEDEFRYRALWEHQHFFPEDWQLQFRAGLVSDPTFLEQWFPDEFRDGLPHDVSAYLKRQRQTEAFTLLANFQPNDFVTTADMLQEQFEIERLPEIGYHRVGDSFADDRFTLFSNNTISALHFDRSGATLADLGYRAHRTPGLPSLGTTGTTGDTVYRGDWRNEIDYPFSVGQFRVVPYILGRYTAYSDSPDSSSADRVFVGTGVRITTAFWKIDDSASNELFDIHRLRHVIEPELHLFTSAQTTDRNDLFIYDEPIDAINDVTAAQIAIHQRWQTKRGGAGLWRSVDFFTLNLEANFFANQPGERELNPTGFRGLFFSTLPEASVPRNSLNADAMWRVSDYTAILSDAQYNLDEQSLASTSIGLAAQRDTRVSYFVGVRYIGQINSTIATLAANYELTAKYSLRLVQNVNLGDRQNQDSRISLIRKFDRFFIAATVYYDAVDDESGFSFGIFPEGLGYGISSGLLQSIFER